MKQHDAGGDDRIAIVGFGCRLPGGANDPDAVWSMLLNGVDTTTEVPASRFDIEALYAAEPKQKGKIASRRGAFVDGHLGDFDAGYFHLAPREAKAMDPQQRMLLEVTVEALADAGIPQDDLVGSATAVYVGTFNNDYEMLSYYRGENVDLYAVLGGGRYTLANRISFAFDLRGPSMHLDSACSSTAVAFHQACEFLAQRRGPAALVAGCNLLVNPFLNIGLSYSGVLSPSGRCRFGDAGADGYIRGEAVGMVVLKRLDDALADGSRIYAVVRGSGVNHDGASNGLLIQPSETTQVSLMHAVWREAGITADDIDYIEAHGTGTRIGDPIELRGFGRALAGRSPERPAYLGSVKTNVGHSEGGSGLASIMKIALALRHRVVPPSLHFETPNPEVDWERLPVTINSAPAAWPTTGRPGLAVMNSFGMTGTNCHLVFEEFVDPRPAPAPSPRGSHLLPISAKSEAALAAQLERYARFLAETDADAADLCHSAGPRATHYPWRVAVQGRDRAALAAALARRARQPLGAVRPEAPKVAFVFSGQGSAWPRMGADLLEAEPLFASAIDEIDRALPPELGWTVRAQLSKDAEHHALADTQVGQFCIFAVQVGLCRLLARDGVAPAAVVGHSLGEVTAAYVAGAIDLAEAIALIGARSDVMRRDAVRGRMVSVALNEGECARRVAEAGLATLGVAALNGPATTVVAGDAEDVARFLAFCAAEGIDARELDVAFAFHSTLLAPFRGELAERLSVVGRDAALPLYSTVTGDRLTGSALDAAHWTANVCDPVRFAPAIASVLRDGYDVLIEIAPHAVLSAAMRELAGPADALVVPTMRKGAPGAASLDQAVGALYALGCPIAWGDRTPEGRVVSLPTYAFQRERYWIDEKPPAPASANADVAAELDALAAQLDRIRSGLGAPKPAPDPTDDWCYRVRWERAADDGGDETGAWLVFADAEAHGRGLPGREVVWVTAGDAFAQPASDHVVLRPGEPADYRRLFEALAAQGLTFSRVVDAWPGRLGGEDAEPSAAYDAVCAHVVAAFQALEASAQEATYWAVTRHGVAVDGAEAPRFAQAGVSGLARALALECPARWGGHLDLDAGETLGVLAGWRARSSELCVAYRRGTAFVPRLERYAPPAGPAVTVSASASYLVTGGLGHIGQAIADHLVDRGARELVLVGRSGPDHPAAAAVKARLAARGARVHLLAVDVADAAQVEGLFAYMRAHCGPLKGIVHGAGAYGYHPIAGLDAAVMAAEMAPKAAGAWHLHAASAGGALDFFWMLSSIAGLWGAGTQAPYAAANAALDGLVALRRAQGLPALGIHWGMWADGGMATPEIAEKLKRTGVQPMAPAEALRALARVANGPVSQPAVTAMDWDRFLALYGSQRPTRFFDALRATPAPQAAPAPVQAPAEIARRALASVLAVEADALDLDRSMLALGLDSLMAVELAAQVEQAGVAVSIGELLRAPSARAWLDGLAPAARTMPSAPAPVAASMSVPAAPAPTGRSVVETWRYVHEAKPEAARRLVCFPYAGGGPFVYHGWTGAIDAATELSTIILPGRMQRLDEAPFQRMEDLVDALAPALLPLFDREVAFFGHCLGALVMFEVTHRLAELAGVQPSRLFVSGARSPQTYTPSQLEIDVMQFSPVPGVPGHELGEADFIEFLKDLNFDTSAALYDSAELRRILLPTVQADLRVNNLYTYREKPPLAMPITVVGGRIDPYVTGNHLVGWRERTTGPFEVFVRAGDHYFIEKERPFLLDLVNRRFGAMAPAE